MLGRQLLQALLLCLACPACRCAAALYTIPSLTVAHLPSRNAVVHAPALARGSLRLGWSLSSSSRRDAQSSWRVLLCASAPPGPCVAVWDSGVVSTPTQHADVPAALLVSHAVYNWSIASICW